MRLTGALRMITGALINGRFRVIGFWNRHQGRHSMPIAATVSSCIQQSKWVAVFATVLVLLLRKARHRFPPGPKRIPLLGSAFNFPKNRWYEVFSHWKAEYGEFKLLSSPATTDWERLLQY